MYQENCGNSGRIGRTSASPLSKIFQLNVNNLCMLFYIKSVFCFQYKKCFNINFLINFCIDSPSEMERNITSVQCFRYEKCSDIKSTLLHDRKNGERKIQEIKYS